MRLLIILIFFLSKLTSILAQDVYELTYQFRYDPAKTIYKGLLFNNADKNGFLRLTALNKKTNKRVLFDFALSFRETESLLQQQQVNNEMVVSDSNEIKYCYLRSLDFKIKEGNKISDFDYLRLWFQKASSSNLFAPSRNTPFNIQDSSYRLKEKLEVINFSGKRKMEIGDSQYFNSTGIVSLKKLNKISFSKTYLQQFFTNAELIYEGDYTLKQLTVVRNNDKPVLFLISVINTEDKDISETCVADGTKVVAYFNRVAEFLDLPIVVKKIRGHDFTANNVRAAISNIAAGKDDILVFHYSGHGFRWKDDDKYPFPQMAMYYGTPVSWPYMKAASINVEEVYNSIKSKGARLNLVMSDCCNTDVKKRRQEVKDTALDQVPTGYYDMNKSMATELFLNTRSSLLLSASKQGQYANCSVAFKGFFTTSIIEAIRLSLKNVGTNPTWMNIIKKAETGTLNLAFQYKQVQNMIYKICDAATGLNCIDNARGNSGN